MRGWFCAAMGLGVGVCAQNEKKIELEREGYMYDDAQKKKRKKVKKGAKTKSHRRAARGCGFLGFALDAARLALEPQTR